MAALKLTISTQEQHPPNPPPPTKKKRIIRAGHFFGPGLNKEKKRIKEAHNIKRAATLGFRRVTFLIPFVLESLGLGKIACAGGSQSTWGSPTRNTGDKAWGSE